VQAVLELDVHPDPELVDIEGRRSRSAPSTSRVPNPRPS
jgi:hypothetical protein